MGQYLFIGIATRISASIKRAKEEFINIGNFKKQFEQIFNRTGIYQMKESDGCIDLCLKTQRLDHNVLDDQPRTDDIFHDVHPTTDWRDAISEGERMKLGTSKYLLKTI